MGLKRKIVYSMLLAGFSSAAIASPWPKATPDNASVVINGGSINIKVLSNDVGTGLVLNSVNDWTQEGGRASLSADKLSINYTPANNIQLQAADAFAPDTFWYAFKDSQGRTNSTKVNIKRLSTWWPQSSPDARTIVNNGNSVSIPVLENDVGVDLYISSGNGYSQKGGIVTVSGDKQKIQYTPKANFTGTDNLWYLTKDSVGRVNSAKVTITVNASHTGWPQSKADSASVNDGQPVLIPVLANDQGQGLKLTGTNDWTQKGGRSKIVGDSIEYTPPADFSGTDAFWYNFEDSIGRTNSAKVTIDVSSGQPNSVVAFCDATYETDGTKPNTQLTSLSPQPPQNSPLPVPVEGNSVEIGNGVYQVIDTGTSPQTLFLTIERDQVVIIATASADKSIDLIGSLGDTVYFVVDNEVLYSHDGSQLKTLAASLSALGSQGREGFPPHVYKGVEFVPSVTSNFYFKVKSDVNNNPFGDTERVYRVSEAGLPVFVGQNSELSAAGAQTYTTTISEIYYFNNIDYHGQLYSLEDRIGGTSNTVSTIQRKSGESLNTLTDFPESIVDDRGRLFVITKASPQIFNRFGAIIREARPSRLYAVNNDNNEFVELSVCE